MLGLGLAVAWASARAESAQRLTYTSATGVTFVVTADGLSSVAVGERTLAEGGWYVWNAGPGWFKRGEAGVLSYAGYSKEVYRQAATLVQEKTLAVISPTHVRVRHVQPDAVATHDYLFDGEDVTVRCRIENNHTTVPLAIPALGGLRFAFTRVPDGILPVWHMSYLQAVGSGAFHPSHLNKIGGSYAADNTAGVGVTPLGAALEQTLVFWDYDKWNPTAADKASRWLTFMGNDAVPPGGALTLSLKLRVSPTVDWQHLLQPYKEHFLAVYGGKQYSTDFRCVAVAHVNRNKEAIGPGNPYGFHGGFRRLDLPAEVGKLCDTIIPGLKAANGQGLIIWGQGGQEPRGEMYRADFDVLPPEVDANWQTLAARFREAGLRLGVCTRPRHLHVRLDWQNDGTIDLNPDDPQHLSILWNRFKRMIDKGCTLFYLDSFGNSLEDVKTMRYLRQQMGPDIRTYAEHACDVLAVYSAFYSETDFWAKGSADWVTEDQWVPRTGVKFLEIVNWMLGPVPVISRAYDIHGKIPDGFETSDEFFYRHVLSPMIEDYMLGEAAARLRPRQDRYVNEDGSLKESAAVRAADPANEE